MLDLLSNSLYRIELSTNPLSSYQPIPDIIPHYRLLQRLHLHTNIYDTFATSEEDAYNIRVIAAAKAAISPPAVPS